MTRLSNPAWLMFLLIAISTFSLRPLIAEDTDWTQWRGPERDGKAANQKLLQSWPASGPKLVWSFDQAGRGYSSVSVDKGVIYTLGKVGDDCKAIAINANNGEQLWSQRIDRATKQNDYLTGWGDGPRSSPTIDGDRVYVLSDLGTLACLNKKDGSPVWSVNLVSDFGGGIPKWGYSESVLIDGDRVIVTPGGQNFIVGLNKATGKKVYESKGFDAGAQYVSVIKANFFDVPVYVTAAARGLMGIHAVTGELLFENPPTGNGIAVIPTPIVSGNIIYHSSAYKAGNAAVEISKKDGKLVATQLYHKNKESMENHHGGYVLDNGTIYGFSKALRGVWMAQDLKTGEVLWSKKVGNATSGSIVYADGLLYCYDDQDGICYLVQPTTTGWSPVGQVKLPKTTATDRGQGAIWAHPVIAEQKLFIRDQEMIFAFDIAR